VRHHPSRLLAAARSGQRQRQLTRHADAAATAALTFISTWHKAQDSKEDDPWEPSSDNAAPGFMCLAPNSVSHARPLTSFASAWSPSKLIALFVCNPLVGEINLHLYQLQVLR
jgi:hypothetical protein